MIEPFAPLYPWLRDALDKIHIRCPYTDYRFPACPKCSKTMEPVRQVGGHLSREQFDSVKAGDWMCGCHNNDRGRAPRGYYWERELPPTTWIDLRHGPTRYAVLRALADAGHARPWALGAPWSPLTDEQAGRATAAILRAVGEDPRKPVGMVPTAIAQRHPAAIAAIIGDCRVRIEYHTGHNRMKVWARNHLVFRHAANADDMVGAARDLGCLMIEDLTP